VTTQHLAPLQCSSFNESFTFPSQLSFGCMHPSRSVVSRRWNCNKIVCHKLNISYFKTSQNLLRMIILINMPKTHSKAVESY